MKKKNMPHERTQVGDEPNQTSGAPLERHTSPEIEDEPGRTPHTSEGAEVTERKMPREEPGRTPGSAEGE